MRHLLATVVLAATPLMSVAQARQGPIPAPTLSEFGLGALVAGMAALGAWIARRRK